MSTAAIVGSRKWSDYRAFVRLLPALFGVTKIVSGGAKGVDAMAERFAREFGYAFEVFRPKRGKDFTTAARSRNQQLVDVADCVVALPGPRSKGTWDTVRRARAKGIRVYVVEVLE